MVKYFNFIAALLLTLLYLTGKIPPTERYNLWFTIFIIPVAMAVNTVLVLGSLFFLKKSSLFYLVPMLIGLPYFLATVGIKKYFHFGDTTGQEVSVLNYNLSNFSIKSFNYNDRDSARRALRDFILNPTTDIQCFQEFTNYYTNKEFNVIGDLTSKGKHFYFSQEDETPYSWAVRTGTLIVSRYPIIAAGDVMASKNGFNRVAYADIVVDKDTVRVINVHLESMGLGQYAPYRRRNIDEAKQSTHTLLSKLKSGVFERSRQVKQLSEFIQHSPHSVICAGDFNDMPYSYSYQYLRKGMKNSFEESGTGFGFTYHGGMLKVLRIDNQFYSTPIISKDLRTRYDIRLSDHFPVEGNYILSKQNP